MSNAIARLAKGSFIYGLGSMLQRFAGLLLLPFFTRALGPEEYGVFALLSLFGIAMNGLLTLGIGNSLGLLFFKEQDGQQRISVVWTASLVTLVNCVFWWTLIHLFAEKLSLAIFRTDHYTGLLSLAFLGNTLTAAYDPLLAYFRMTEKAAQYVLITVSTTITTLAISIWLVLYLQLGLFGLVLAIVAGQGFGLLTTFSILCRQAPILVDHRFAAPLIRIGFPSIFGLFAFLLIDYADRQLIERLLGLTELGVYSVGYTFGMVMTVLMGAFATAWSPFFSSYRHSPEEASGIFSRVMTYYCAGFAGLVLIFFTVSKPIVLLMTPEPFHQGWTIIGPVAAAYALKGCYLIALPGIYFAEKLHLQSILEWLAALVNIGLNFLLIPMFGILGAALATLFCYGSLVIFAQIVSNRYLQVKYDKWRILVIALTASTFSGASHLSYTSFPQVLVPGLISAFLCIIYLVITYKLVLTARDRRRVLEFIFP